MNRIEIPAGARTAPEPEAQDQRVLQQPTLFSSSGVTDEPGAEQLREWCEKSARLAGKGPARQLVVAFEVEIWAIDDKPLAAKLDEALDTYRKLGQSIENGAEIVLPNGAALRHRYINRYYDAGNLVDVVPRGRPADVSVNDPRLDA